MKNWNMQKTTRKISTDEIEIFHFFTCELMTSHVQNHVEFFHMEFTPHYTTPHLITTISLAKPIVSWGPTRDAEYQMDIFSFGSYPTKNTLGPMRHSKIFYVIQYFWEKRD